MVEDIEFHQDNISAMITEKNGKESITNGTKHIQLLYLFIKDHIENGDLYLKY